MPQKCYITDLPYFFTTKIDLQEIEKIISSDHKAVLKNIILFQIE